MASSVTSTGVVSKISLGSHPGREILATMADGTKIQMRVYLDGERVYVIEVDDAKGTKPSADVQRFLVSFQIH